MPDWAGSLRPESAGYNPEIQYLLFPSKKVYFQNAPSFQKWNGRLELRIIFLISIHLLVTLQCWGMESSVFTRCEWMNESLKRDINLIVLFVHDIMLENDSLG